MRKVIYFTCNVLYIIIIIYILCLQCIFLYLQQYNFYSLFNLVITFEENDDIGPATIKFKNNNDIVIPRSITILSENNNNFYLQDNVTKTKYYLITDTNYSLIFPTPFIQISRESQTIQEYSRLFVVTLLSSEHKRFLINVR